MIRLSMLDLFILFGALSKHNYIIVLEDGSAITDIIDNQDCTQFLMDGSTYNANDKVYISIYKPLSKSACISLLVKLANPH